MSVQHKETSIQGLKGIMDNKTLTRNVQALETESTITSEAVIEAWVSSMEVSQAVLELANMVFNLVDEVADLKAQLAGQAGEVKKDG